MTGLVRVPGWQRVIQGTAVALTASGVCLEFAGLWVAAAVAWIAASVATGVVVGCGLVTRR